MSAFDGTPCAVKAARTVWNGGKGRDCIKALPIVIEYAQICLGTAGQGNHRHQFLRQIIGAQRQLFHELSAVGSGTAHAGRSADA